MILCAGKVIYGIFGFRWVLHQLNLQILKSSFRSTSLTHNPYCSIYKYKFGTDNHTCKLQGLYLHIYVEGSCASGLRLPQPKILGIGGVVYQPMELSPGWGMGLRTWRMMVLVNKGRQVSYMGHVLDKATARRRSGNWIPVGLKPRSGPTKDVWDQTKDTCIRGSSQRSCLFKKYCSIFLHANLNCYSWCPCLIYTRAPSWWPSAGDSSKPSTTVHRSHRQPWLSACSHWQGRVSVTCQPMVVSWPGLWFCPQGWDLWFAKRSYDTHVTAMMTCGMRDSVSLSTAFARLCAILNFFF